MMTHPRIAAYLDAVTSTMEGDDELRLDVRAELSAHLDEAAARFEAEGHSPDESAELAIKTLGPATDYAGDLVAANRGRMRLRGRIRLLLRALVIPAAIAAAVISLWGVGIGIGVSLQMGALQGSGGGTFCGLDARLLQWLGFPDRRLSREQRLILDGDITRADSVAAQRAIWEAWPTNIVYLNNYLTTFFAEYNNAGSTPAERFAVLSGVLDKAIALDPHNARYVYMRAAKRFQQGAAVETIDLGKNDNGESRSDFRLTIRDRAMLDQAMADLLAATRLPVLRRYSRDMLAERLAIMGQPASFAEQIRQTTLAASIMLPDLSAYRNLARASVAYAKVLIAEGHRDEARAFIEAWQPLSIQVADDSFTLIDILVAGAIARIGRDNAAALYHELGDTVAEARTLEVAGAIYAPAGDFRERAHSTDPEQDRLIRQHAGALAGMLLPASGESVTAAELEPCRMVEYVLLDRMTCGVISLALMFVIFAALLVALSWQCVRGGGGAPLLLLPGAHQTLRTLGYGVILPLFVYALWTRIPSLGNRAESLATAWPVALMQSVTLVAAIVIITMAMSARAIRARCATLQIESPVQRRRPWGLWAFACGGGVLLALTQCLRLLRAGDSDVGVGQGVAAFLAAGLGLVVGITGCVVFFRYLCGSARYGLYRGTVARSIIPHLAMAVVLVTLLTYPYLRAMERHLVRTDPLMSTASNRFATGFTAVEARATERLRAEMLKAAGR